VGEVERLISDPAIPPERRVQYALKAIAGLRHGEVAALRWRELDYTAEPLARIKSCGRTTRRPARSRPRRRASLARYRCTRRSRRSSRRGGSRTGRGSTVASRLPMTSWCPPAT
jgi:integrase